MTARTRSRTRVSATRARPAAERWKPWLPIAIPLLVAPLLSLRTLGWPFLWDDFDFLGRVLGLHLTDLLPQKDVVFYRPISREIYFWLITRPFGPNPPFAHMCNTLLAVGVVLLTAALSRRLMGTRAGAISGSLMACGAAMPMVMGWISGAQDLLCAGFFLLACHLQLSRRPVASAAAMACALLSKETAIALLAVPVATPLLLRGGRKEVVTTLLAHAAVLAAWILIHPWFRGVGSGAVSPGGAGAEYVALRLDSALGKGVHGVLTALHLAWPGSALRWTGQNLLPTALAIAALWIGLRALPRSVSDPAPRTTRVAVVLGLWILLAATAVTALTARIWSPYYAMIPSIGVSLLGGALLHRQSTTVVTATLAAFLTLGVLLRDVPGDPTLTTEINFAETAAALERVERGFKELRPEMPRGAAVYVSVQAREQAGLYRQIFRFQPLRIWYADEEIWTLDPNRRRPTSGPDLLFWITQELDVYEIDLTSLEPMGPTSEVPVAPYQKTLRGYALGLASSGKVDRAVEILTIMPQVDEHVRNLDHRFAAMLLDASGRPVEAARLVSTQPDLTRDVSVGSTANVLYEPVPGMELDLAAMRAFEVSPDDVPALRAIMLQLEAQGADPAAERFARRILSLDSADSASVRILGKVRGGKAQEITAPVPHDIPQ